MWKIISKKLIFKCDFFTLRSEQCRDHKDQLIDNYYLLDSKDWVQVVALDESKSFIMVEQYRHGGAVKFLEFPGGVVDSGEELSEAATRELLEETGYSPGRLTYLGYDYPNPALQTNKIHLYVAESCTRVSEQSLDPHEEISIKLMEEQTLISHISKGSNHALMLSSYLKYTSLKHKLC